MRSATRTATRRTTHRNGRLSTLPQRTQAVHTPTHPLPLPPPRPPRRVILEDPRSRWDQGEFNRIARLEWRPQRTGGLSDSRLFWSYKNAVIGGVMNLALFCGGHNYFVGQFAQRSGRLPYSIHTTYQYGGAAGKRHRLREAGVWIDPPEYYAPVEGLLVYAPDIPRAMIFPPGGMNTRQHIALVEMQLRQMRSAFALAFALKRKLVLPKVWCGFDKGWYSMASGRSKGIFPGGPGWAVPIANCPLDHYLEPSMLEPVTYLREYSFLENVRTPAQVKGGVVPISINLEPRGDRPSLRALFSKLEANKAKVLNVTNLGKLPDLLGSGLLPHAAKHDFKRKFANARGGWCCAPQDDLNQGMPRSATFKLMHV